TGLSPPMGLLSRSFCFIVIPILWSYNLLTDCSIKIWALPRSLATTWGIIIIFFSSSYLDVSVLWVGYRLRRLTCLQHARFSHSEIYGYNARLQLSVAYRSLPRPSSPLGAKASTVCPYLL